MHGFFMAPSPGRTRAESATGGTSIGIVSAAATQRFSGSAAAEVMAHTPQFACQIRGIDLVTCPADSGYLEAV